MPDHRACALAALLLAGSAGCGGGAGPTGSCDFTVTRNEVSAPIPTVGVVEWSLAGPPPSSAKIVYAVQNGDPAWLNQGGEAPVPLGDAESAMQALRDAMAPAVAAKRGAA